MQSIEGKMVGILATRIANLEIEKARLVAQALIDAEIKEAEANGNDVESEQTTN